MTTAAPCPDENTLARVAEGASGTLAPALEAHLDVCEACRRAIAAAASPHTLPSAVPTTELRPGMRVGRYEIERELGRGGMGVVSMARDLTLDRRVAMKLLHARRDPEAQARLLREAQVMARLAHPNVVPVFELGDWQGELYLVMELVNGVTLQAWLKAASRSRGEILQKFLAAGRGLAAAHACGVIHRDFKPANVLVGLDGRARVTDFGLSRPGPSLEVPPMASPLVTREGALVGTVVYMAPEQLDGEPATERSDQFAFCVSLAEALTGERPFEGESWSELAISHAKPPRLAGVPRSMRPVLRKGLSRTPSQRYTSLTSMLDALERSQRQPTLALGAAAAAAMLATAVVVGRPVPQPAATIAEAPAVDTQQVLVASRDISEGEVLSIDLLTLQPMPSRFVTASFVKPEAVTYALATTVVAPLMKGDAMLWSHLAAKGPAVVDVSQFLAVAAADDVSAELASVPAKVGPLAGPLAVAKPDFATCSALSPTHGHAVLSWNIDRAGKPADIVATPGAGAVEIATCFSRVLQSITFPAGEPSDGVRYLFRY